jgi:hypothetical protein
MNNVNTGKYVNNLKGVEAQPEFRKEGHKLIKSPNYCISNR